jgi:succinate dehydrogenase / fumarate reductase, flavoprotein subunit
MTNIRGLYAFGEVNFAYHGANRLGANALLSCIFDGLFAGQGVATYVRDGEFKSAPAEGLSQGLFDAAVASETRKAQRLLDSTTAGDGSDKATNPYQIALELGQEMTAACTVVKSGPRLEQCTRKLTELRERFGRVRLGDSAGWTNQTLSFTRAVGDMLVLAEVIAKGSIERKESRGAHYRSDYPERNDEQFLKTTVAKYDAASGQTRIDWSDVTVNLVKPRLRNYGKSESAKAEPAKALGPAAASTAKDMNIGIGAGRS